MSALRPWVPFPQEGPSLRIRYTAGAKELEISLEVFEKIKNHPRKIRQSKQAEQRGLPDPGRPLSGEAPSPGRLELALIAEMSAHHGEVRPEPKFPKQMSLTLKALLHPQGNSPMQQLQAKHQENPTPCNLGLAAKTLRRPLPEGQVT